MKFLPLLAFLIFLSLPAGAQTTPSATAGLGRKDLPLEINADQTLEWKRNEQQYIARGNASAQQGDFTVKADTLIADYHPTEKSSNDIYLVTAIGNVIMTNADSVVVGDKAVYNLDTGHAVVTGHALKMTSPDQVVTARDNFEYDTNTNIVTAHGNAVAVRGDQTLLSDQMSAYFVKDDQGQNQLSRMTADGNVIIKTPTETVTGDHAVYNADTQIADVTGPVRIVRGPNVLEGKHASVNMATNISHIDAGPAVDGKPGRVRGIFYTHSNDNPPNTPSGDPSASTAEKGGVTPPANAAPTYIPQPIVAPTDKVTNGQ